MPPNRAPRERRGEHQQQPGHHDDVGDRAAHHRARDAVPDSLPGGRVRRAPAPPVDQVPHRQRVDPGPEHGQQSRQQDQGGEHRDKDGPHAAEPHRAEEDLREDEQPAQRDGDGDAGHRDRAPGRRHGPGQGVLHPGLPDELLAEPADHEQPVVDRQAQPQDGDHVDREDGHVGDQREGTQGGERADDRSDADGQRQGSRCQAAEEDQQQHRQDRQRDGLGHRDVRAHLLVHVAVQRHLTAELRGQAGCGEDVLDGVEDVLPLVLVAAQRQDGVGALPVRTDQRGVPRADVGHRTQDVLRQRLERGGDRLGVARVVNRQVLGGVQDHDVGGAAAQCPFGHLGGPGALAARVVEAAAGHLPEDRRAPRAGDGDQHHGKRHHPPAAAVHHPAESFEHRSSPVTSQRCGRGSAGRTARHGS